MKFNLPVLETWLDKNRPGAMKKLADKTGYSIPAIEKVRQTGRIPRAENLQSLAEALNMQMSDLVLFDSGSGKRAG